MTDKLPAGQELRNGDKLVSPNGRFTLFMQPDGNLVLYEGVPEVASAYWATNTWVLPPESRPTTARMQADAHFVLYDSSDVPRWATGTWGPSYTDPYLVLEDDGNLIIYHHGKRPVWASGRVGGAGAIPGRGYVPASPTLNQAIDNLGRMPAIVVGSTDLGPPTTSTVDVNGVAYLVTEQRRRLVNEVVEHAYLQDISRIGAWPGQTIQSRALMVGDVAAVGPLPRQPGKIEITTNLISNTPQPQSVEVDDPDAAKVNQARREILNAVRPSDTPGQIKADFLKATTLRELGVKAGVTVKGSAFGVDANATLNQTYRQSTVVAVIRQTFYTVTFTPLKPQAAGMWTDDDDTFDALAPYVGVGNPPLYIDSVQYGRFICVTAQGSSSSSDLTAALKATWQASVSGTVNVDVRTKELLESSEVKIYTIGVPGHDNFKNLGDPIPELQQVYTSGLKFSLDNPGAPISFTCRHIADNTLGHVALAAEYTHPVAAQGQDFTTGGQPIEVFDGPGGGLVDTHVPVNPGDKVVISAGGAIWSGVAFSGVHGPEGWPGHRADPAAPLPTGTAYCLVHRFGSRPEGWVETARFWEGSPGPEGGGGILQLNVNDNNPYNGDPTKRWRVDIDVKRANAAAVGVYV